LLDQKREKRERAYARRQRWIHKLRARLRDRYKSRCNYPGCVSRQKLEFAHLKPTSLFGRSRGRIERLLDVLRNPGCYILMCKYCHRRYDAEQIRARKEELDKRIQAAVESAYKEEVPF
jgi:hypothetical protein